MAIASGLRKNPGEVVDKNRIKKPFETLMWLRKGEGDLCHFLANVSGVFLTTTQEQKRNRKHMNAIIVTILFNELKIHICNNQLDNGA